MKNTRKLVYMAMFIAIEIILTRVVSLMPSNITRISLSFIIYAFAGHMFGPLFSLTSALIGDLVGAILFPPIGGFFPGFTLSAAVSGFLFGFIKLEKGQFKRLFIILILNTLIVDFIFNTLWLNILTNTPFMVLLYGRLPGIIINNILRIVMLITIMQKGVSEVLDENRYSDRTNSKT